MKILYCGTVVPEKYDVQLRYLSPAANRFQMNMLTEMARQGHEIFVLSYIGFPIPDEVCFEKLEYACGVEYVYKRDGFARSVQKYRQRCKELLSHMDMVMAYNVDYASLGVPGCAGRNGKKSLLILADYSDAKSYKNVVGKAYASWQLRAIRKYDMVVGLSAWTERLVRKEQPFFLMEGGLNKTVFEAFEEERSAGEVTTILYAGTLEKVTGIDLLLEAFSQINRTDVKLCITGKGSLQQMVDEYAAKDGRIINLGYLEYDEYLDRLGSADILVNPRNMSLPENRNNFPSKVIEYLATGNYVLSTRFSGSEKYEEVIAFCESSVQGIKGALESAITEAQDETESAGMRRREFVEQFLWECQVAKIVRFVRDEC